MATLETQGISLYYETYGDRGKPPVMLIAGLGGTGASWATQVRHFAEKYMVIVPDHRGTGRSTRTLDGHVTSQLALDFAALIEHLDLGPCTSWVPRRVAPSRSTWRSIMPRASARSRSPRRSRGSIRL